ncbi:Cellulose synthase [Macleaya cordata]|uniref:Cellulose synthase n=1 Tax=Macleaya cordata TaxID=56857 RepID=A0A200Q4F9_MACCD|nr:Cellulose synthase [Macleaya cordata]
MEKIEKRVSSLPLHEVQVQTLRANINRIHSLFHTIAVLCLFYYRLSHLIHAESVPTWPWILLFSSEFILGFIWFLTQAFRWRPVSRAAFQDRIDPNTTDLPGVDVFVCTADPTKEPTLEVMNTVLSSMSLDYPPEKLSVYLSDDGGSSLTLFGIKEAGVFARSWIPFCRNYGIKTRCPEAYFTGTFSDDERIHRSDLFKADEEQIKAKYKHFKDSVEKASENAATSQDRAPQIEIICGNDGTSDLPRLVYVSRERRPTYPHRFKAGALNALLRVSGIISNAPYILVLDCDMYCNDPTSAKQAMCFHMDPKISPSLAFVQFPQIFYNVSKNDIYDGQARSAYKTKWQGMDGLRGPVLSGTGFYLKRKALYGTPKQEDVYITEPKSCFGPSTKFIKSLHQDYEGDDDKDSSTNSSLLQEARFLASCAFEKNTQWGDRIGFSYQCLLESTFTGYLLHCKGWTSVYCFPSKPCFLGCTTINMKDALVQALKWCSGLFQVGISKYSPLTYGMSRMSALQSMCYAYFTMQPLFALALIIYGVIPQLYLVKGIPLYPKVSDPWFAVFAIVYVSALCQHLAEVLTSGGTLLTWWNEQRIWMIKSVTANFFGCLDVIMKWIGVTKASFRLTNKVIDTEHQKKYEKGVFDFEGATTFMIPLIILVILNLGCFLLGARRVLIDKSYEEMFGQVFLSFIILVLSYPILEGIVTRKKGGI